MLGAAFVILAWLSTAVFVARFAVSVARRGGTAADDRRWFLAPATLLGAGIAAGVRAGQAVGLLTEVLRWAALLVAGIGMAGCSAVAAHAALALACRGLGQGQRVVWWITAGCGGLVAVAAAWVLSAGRLWSTDVVTLAHGAAIITWSFAALLAVPILAASVHLLARNRRSERAAPWPPTFSTAVFALGALGTGKMVALLAMTDVGKAAAAVTLALWTVVAALHASRLLPSAPRRCAARSVGRRGPPQSTGELASCDAGAASPLRSSDGLVIPTRCTTPARVLGVLVRTHLQDPTCPAVP